MNASFAHIQTDRPKFYMNKELSVDTGIISSYDENLQLQRASSSDDMISIEASETRIYGDADERMRIGSTVTIWKPTRINYQVYGGFGAATTGGTTDWNDSSNARSGNGYTLLLEDATNGPTDSCVNSSNTTYMHPFSFEYASWDNDGNMTQFGIPYYFANDDGVRPAVRSRYSGTWSAWHSLITGNAAGQIQGSAGTAGAPSYSFNGNGVGDLDTGMYRVSANTIGFSTGGSNRVTIDSSGLGVGITPAEVLDLKSASGDCRIRMDAPDGSDCEIKFYNDGTVQYTMGYDDGADEFRIGTSNVDSGVRFKLTDNGVNIADGGLGVDVAPSTTDGRIDAANDVVAYSTSDKRLKENIKPLDNALDKVMQISGVEFDWKKLTEKEKETIHGNEGHDVGVIAQEIEEVLPEVVTQRDSGYKAVKYEKIVPLLIEAIKEQQKQIQELKNG